MHRSKIMALAFVLVFAAGITVVDNVLAADKIKGRNFKYTTKFEPVEVGDEEGHIVAVYEAKGIDHRLDEVMPGASPPFTECGILDMNTNTGVGSGSGYGITSYSETDKMYWSWQGELKEGIWRGTFTFVKGTSKFEGIKGGGTYVNYTVAPYQNYADWEGEQE